MANSAATGEVQGPQGPAGSSGATPTGTGFVRVTAGVLESPATITLDTDSTLAANSDTRVSSQKATKTYSDTKVPSTRTISTTAPVTGGGDLSANRTIAVSTMVGDSGSGGAAGVVPAPAAGDAAAGKFLNAGGTFSIPSGVATNLRDFPDCFPKSANAMDDEFESASLSGAWTTQNIGSSGDFKISTTWQGCADFLRRTDGNFVGAKQAVPAAQDWDIRCKIIVRSQTAVTDFDCGMVLERASTHGVSFGFHLSTSIRVRGVTWGTGASVWTAPGTGAVQDFETVLGTLGATSNGISIPLAIYFRFTYTNSTHHIKYYWSSDGQSWWDASPVRDLDTTGDLPAFIGVGLHNGGSSGGNLCASIAWFRRFA